MVDVVIRPVSRIKTVASCLVLAGGLLFPSGSASAGATESARGQTTVTVGQNAITVDNSIKYQGYRVGEAIDVTLDYSSSCHVVFRELTLWTARPFMPAAAKGAIANVRGTPAPGNAGTTGSVTFTLRFDAVPGAPEGPRSALARLNLLLGVDRDCDLATGDPDGIDETTTIRALIAVSTAP